jgi:hypothetical protein
MTENLVKARSTIVFIVALLVATMLAVWIERESARHAGEENPAVYSGQPAITASSDLPALPKAQPLTPQERDMARLAWKYFENNTHAATGLVNSVQDYPAATMWDTASYLLALVSASRLELLPQEEFDRRMAQALRSLALMPLYDNALPNKSYDVRTLAMVDYAGKETPKGIGWSAIDIGRLMVPLNIIAWRYPQHTGLARQVISRWNTGRLAQKGHLYGISLAPDGSAQLLQEGRLGYEQYAAKTFSLLGLDVHAAQDYLPQLALVDIYDIGVPYDRRDPKKYGAGNFVVSEPYVLDGLEFGWDSTSRELAWRVYRAQEQRHRKTGKLTAVTEDNLDRAPYFLYNAVYSGGKAWNPVTEKGVSMPELRTMSVKAAFAWHALYRSAYTTQLVAAAAPLHDRDKGYYAGLYEESGAPNKAITANTNAVVLESLAFIAGGKLLNLQEGGAN